MALGDEYKVLKTFLIWAQTDIDFVVQKFLRKYVDNILIPLIFMRLPLQLGVSLNQGLTKPCQK